MASSRGKWRRGSSTPIHFRGASSHRHHHHHLHSHHQHHEEEEKKDTKSEHQHNCTHHITSPSSPSSSSYHNLERRSLHNPHTWLLVITLFTLIFQGSDGVKDVQLEAPRYARRGEDLILRCNYDLETDSLYAVKWYRGSEEFYRFLPKEAPPKQAFPIPGVRIVVNKSDDHTVFLRNISFETNGRFKCVISAEGTFQTLENQKEIDVVVIDYNSPKLYLDKMNYQPGDKGLAKCSIEKTFPAPNVTWFINGKQVNNISVLTRVEVVEESVGGGGMRYTYTTPSTTTTFLTTAPTVVGGAGAGNGTTSGKGGGSKSKLTSTVSTLHFPIQSYSPLTIKCMGQLYDLYNETTSIQIQPKAPLLYPYPTLSTPRSQRKFGMADQLQTFNTTGLTNGGVQLNSRETLLLLTILITAQIFHWFFALPFQRQQQHNEHDEFRWECGALEQPTTTPLLHLLLHFLFRLGKKGDNGDNTHEDDNSSSSSRDNTDTMMSQHNNVIANRANNKMLVNLVS